MNLGRFQALNGKFNILSILQLVHECTIFHGRFEEFVKIKL